MSVCGGGKNVFKFGRNIFEIFKSYGNHYIFCGNDVSCRSYGAIAMITYIIKPINVHRQCSNLLLLLEPLSIRQIQVSWDWVNIGRGELPQRQKFFYCAF